MIVGIWWIAIPKGLLQRAFERALMGDQVQLEVEDLEKSLLYGVKARQIRVRKGEKTLLSINDVTGLIHPISLLRLRLRTTFEGQMGGGRLEGEAVQGRGGSFIRVRLARSDIGKISELEGLGLRGKGFLSAEYELRDGRGDLKFSLQEAQMEEVSKWGIRIPLQSIRSAKGMVTIRGDAVEVHSVSLEGEGIYARLKGQIKGEELDMTVELMPESTFNDTTNLLWMARIYQNSHGHYLIPLKGSLREGLPLKLSPG